MAEAIPSNQDLFTCPFCLELMEVPVTILCGHTYCMDCIKGHWDQEDRKEVYCCPQCRQTFTPRPVLNKNNIIAELVEQIRKNRIQAATPAQCFAGPGDVECSSCTGRKLKAVKSCLVCLVSYCETHLQRHDELFSEKKHNVVDATGQLQEKICAQHQKLLEIFCRTDQSCICFLCMVDEHKGHDTISAAAEKTEKQKQLEETKMRFQQRIQEREKKLQELKKAVEALKSSAQTAVEDSERIFAEMIRSIERRRSEVTELIRAQEKAEVSWAEGLLKQLEQEIAELKRRDAEMEQLSHTEDHIYFLQAFQSVTDTTQCKDFSSITINQSLSFETVKKTVSTLKEQLEDFCKQEVINISAADSCRFSLDPNTARKYLHLSEGNRSVECRAKVESYPDHPERFDRLWQVLCREGVSGRCYWEVERSGLVCIAVSYKNISRKGGGDECCFGCNYQSWRLELFRSSSSFWHNNEETKLPVVASSRIGVYVDHSAGILAFYSISYTKTLLHRVQTTFTHTLYPGFWLKDYGSSVKLL